MESIISTILFIIAIYLLIGVIFSIIFLWKGIQKVDASTEETSFLFKLLLFPAMTVLWVIFLKRWIGTKSA